MAAVRRAANILQAGKAYLGDNGSELATGGRNTVGCTSVTRREHFTRYNKCGGVWAEVLEEVGQAVEENKGAGSSGGGGEFVVTEAYRTEVNTGIK